MSQVDDWVCLSAPIWSGRFFLEGISRDCCVGYAFFEVIE
jgi:hypothetical protein